MWRNCVDGARDFYLLRSKNGTSFSKAMKLGVGTWKINACTMDGGGITHDGTRTITVGRREGDIYISEPGKAETKLGKGKDVAVAASQGTFLLAMDSKSRSACNSSRWSRCCKRLRL
jgi:hypothetical protein